MEKIIVNHVMSRKIESGIFDAILSYFKKYSPANIEHVESDVPVEFADVYHYHRPHLESSLKKNSVCTVHHDLNDVDPWLSRGVFIKRYKEASAVICLNSTQKKILAHEDFLDYGKLFVCPHGYNEEVLSLKNKSGFSSGDKLSIGIASRRYGRRVKGEAYLYDLIKRLDPSKFKFVLVGQDRDIDAIVMRRLGYEVDVYTRLPYRVYQGFYESIDFLLMCSSFEGGPANIPESLATGTPVLSSMVGMSNDLIEDGRNGKFLTLDPDKDAMMIDGLYENRSLRLSLFEGCRVGVAGIPTWRDSINSNISVYRNVLGIKEW